MINHAKHSLIAALIGMFFCQFFTSYVNTLAFFSGMVWGLANILAIAFVLKFVLIVKNYILLLPALLIKFPLLYWVGYLLLTIEAWNPWFVVIGFSVMLTIILGVFLAHLTKLPIIFTHRISRRN